MAYRSLSDRVAAELKRANPDPKPEPQFSGNPTYTPPPEKKKAVDYGYDPERVRDLVERRPEKPKPVRFAPGVLRDLRKMKRPGQ